MSGMIVTADDFTLVISETDEPATPEPELVEYKDPEKPILGHTLSASPAAAAQVLALRLSALRGYKAATVALADHEGMTWDFDINQDGWAVDRVTVHTHAA